MKLFRVGPEEFQEDKCGGCNYLASSWYLFANTQEEADKEYKESGGMCSDCVVEMMVDDNIKIKEVK